MARITIMFLAFIGVCLCAQEDREKRQLPNPLAPPDPIALLNPLSPASPVGMLQAAIQNFITNVITFVLGFMSGMNMSGAGAGAGAGATAGAAAGIQPPIPNFFPALPTIPGLPPLPTLPSLTNLLNSLPNTNSPNMIVPSTSLSDSPSPYAPQNLLQMPASLLSLFGITPQE